MKVSEIRALSLEEVVQRLSETRDEYATLRLQLATKQLPNPLRVRLVRQDIARLETILREHQLGIRPLIQVTTGEV
ncbi:MAG: 50S ribosomal protein L29 [Candidatus Latescibacteria bacterium]|nr:50S ribosomal protein L29 [Candidatus Latescibacterota bacterium]